MLVVGIEASETYFTTKKAEQYLQAQIKDYKATRKEYVAAHKSDALKQMANAGMRPASLLNNLNWK
jgi:hypothetical protein